MAQASGIGRQLAAAAMSAPFLRPEEERELAVRWRDHRDVKAMHELARAHMRLVIALAVRFRHYGISVPDLVQEGHVGLMEAAARFEPEREVRFSTYATWWIRASMQDYILHNWSIVRGGTSSAQKALFFNFRRIRAKLTRGGEAVDAEVFTQIAAAVGVARSDVEMMDARLSAPDVSLNAPIGETEGASPTERVEFLVDNKPLPDEAAGLAIDTDRRINWLNDALTSLNERERRILRERRLVDEAVTLEALGDRLGISKERVRQIESRALEKLRLALTKRHMEGVADAMI